MIENKELDEFEKEGIETRINKIDVACVIIVLITTTFFAYLLFSWENQWMRGLIPY